MEMYQLKYFVAVARVENIHAAARASKTSVGSLAKAIRLLEEELGIALFQRVKRNIRLTPQGRILQSHAVELLAREESARNELSGKPGQGHLVIAGQEILFAPAFTDIETKLKKLTGEVALTMINRDTTATLAALDSGEAQLGLITADPPTRFQSKKLLSSTFRTYIGKGHPLFTRAKSGKLLPVTEVLKHPFVTINQGLFGPVDRYQSFDGWRDDQFPRNILYRVESLRMLELLVSSGRAIAYLPDYFADQENLTILNISGCPYSCKHSVYLIARKAEGMGLVNRIFE